MSTWYISTTGSDIIGDGSLENPFFSINIPILICSNGDTFKLLDGIYTITSTININKRVNITSNSGIKTGVILDANCTIFNLQESNISITNMTLQTSNSNFLITIDIMSDGLTIPTFWSSIIIDNCNIKYVKYALSLNGSFTVSNNTFTRMSGTEVAEIIRIFSCRSDCGVNTNTLTDSGSVNYFIYMTSTGSGTYLDRCNSKGGMLTITNNTLTLTHASKLTTVIYQDYFNLYDYGSIQDNQYNINTKLNLTIANNTCTLITRGKFINILIKTNNSLSMFGVVNINSNNINNTRYGVLHLDKDTSTNSAITIDNIDLTKNVFKIYSNILNTQNIITNYLYIPLNTTNLNDLTCPSATVTVNSTGVVSSGTTPAGIRDGKPSAYFNNVVGTIFKIDTSTTNFFRVGANELFTVQFYTKIIPGSASWQSVFGLNTASAGILVRLRGATASFFVNSANTNIISYVADDTWTFISIVRNITTQKVEFYVDEIKKSEIGLLNTAVLNNSNLSLYLGVSGHSTGERMFGYISDFLYVKGISSPTSLYSSL